MVKKSILLIMLLISFLYIYPAFSYADFSLSGGSSVTGTANSAQPISDVQIAGTGTEPVPVKLFVTSGTLSMSTTTGLTFDGASSGSTIYFSGTVANINAALATLTYTRSSTGTDTLEVSLVPRGEVFFTENNHLYKFISGSITANNARTAALAQTAYGATGYLATITSQSENDFVAARLQGDGWMGASDAAVEGNWKWLDGPEANTQFWSGASGGSTVGGNYANWASGEPNDYGSGEDCAQFYISTGKWNDLPCTGTTLTGYVVEFGASGNMPTVVAKNVSISTVDNPTVNSFTPADNATGITANANLVITFSRTINKGTGNIIIKKSSDDSIIETIDVTSSQVTGAGTSTITIDPSITFAESTGYYITIASTAFKDNSNNLYAGISSNSTWNFTTGDFTAPTISAIATNSITDAGATIQWTTNENASTKVTYGLTSSYGSTTSETDTSPRVTSHTKSLTGLLACTTYHFAVISIDSSSNSRTSTDGTFTTTGCTANTSPTNTSSNTLNVSGGGTTSLTNNNTQLQITTPNNVTTGASTVVIQIKAIDGTSVINSVGRPSAVPKEVGTTVFDVKAIVNSNTVLDSFDAPVTITYTYAEADIQGLDESSLWLYHYHNGSWEALTSCTINMATNTITCTTPNFSVFGLFGRQPSSSGALTNNTTGLSTCNSIKPDIKPDLFQIDTTHNKAIIYFTPLQNNVTNYFIAYGFTAGDERFGTMTGLGPSKGVLSYTINHLDKNTTYYFKIRPQNGCATGDWSNEMRSTTTGQTLSKAIFYKNILAKAWNAVFTSHVTNIDPKPVLGAKTRKESAKEKTSVKSCAYEVQLGDSLWNIATEKLGDGFKAYDLMKQNNITSPVLRKGQIIQVGC